MDNITKKKFEDFTEEFLNENTPRSVIIVGSSKIEELILAILTSVLINKVAKQKEQDELLEGDNALSTFSSKIKMIYRLGIIDISFYNVLDKIRKIRNIGAHQLSFDITISPLKEHVLDLYRLVESRNSYLLTLKRFYGVETLVNLDKLKCCLITVCVLLQVIETKISRLKINRSLNKITAN